ncbi:DUF4236 domain-containing protein [Nocardia sp. BMG111209]|uniref:DUF4236 domain-containing protein n=1 Tax=Nocardia sp. BMG111209 TaxID=1160137 RepID=UPI00036FF15E|nr:DUF4236 domain-containing protein [Nocardia sp. BMG111209]
MGFYVRKSLKAGPFRFNLSKSGIGVSAGVPGFRVGSGPRGNYVHMGRGGVYYRATPGGRRRSAAAPPRGRPISPQPAWLPGFSPSAIVMADVTGSTALEMAPSGSGTVVDQLEAAAARTAWGWWAVAASFVLGLFAGMPLGAIVWLVLAPLCGWLILNDKARRTVVLFYDIGDEHYAWFDALVANWAWFTGSHRIWRVLQSGAVATTYQYKANSGAAHVLRRVVASASMSGPKQLTTNIAVPSLTADSAALYFLPDRVLVREGKRFSDVSYADLGLQPGRTRFIENTSPPGDAAQVDHTWQYVNVRGGPDRRYKNNRLLPVMLYGTVDLTSAQGLRWHLQVSRADAAAPICQVLASAPTRSRPVTSPPPPLVPVRGPLAATAARAEKFAPARGFDRAQLTRTVTSYPVTGVTFTAVDLETTGLDPETDRIVEIGLVKFTADGTVVDEFATLVNNPGSPSAARDVHGIEDSDLAGAPSTGEVLSEAFAFLTGTVVVAHNLDFDEGFLAAAARRAGIPLPDAAGICTLQTARRQLDGRAFSLVAMYKTATGGWLDRQHTALEDARAVRAVVLWLLRNAPGPLHLTRPLPAASAAPVFRQCSISCRPVPLRGTSIAGLLDSFPQSPAPRTGDPAAIEKYRAALSDAVEDGRLTHDEARVLTDRARLTGLTGIQLRSLNREAWEAAFPEDRGADRSTLTPARRREMYLLAEALGLPELAERINEVIRACAEPAPAPQARYLRSLRIAIVGQHAEVLDLRRRAESYGARLAVNITETVQWMVTATPEAADSRHNTARKLNIPIIGPAEGEVRLGEAIREAEARAAERQREVDANIARRRQRDAESDAYWRPVWRPSELTLDPGPQRG